MTYFRLCCNSTHIGETSAHTDDNRPIVQCEEKNPFFLMGNRKSIDDNKMPIDSPLKMNESSNASSTDLKIDETLTDDLDKSAVCTTESESKTVSNTDSNERKASSEEPTNENNNNINNMPKVYARPSGKKSTSPKPVASCAWCHEERPDLNYILPTLSGDSLEFCSEACIVEFRKAVKKGACKQCGNAVRPITAPNGEYCSTACLNKAKPTNGKILKQF